MVLCGCFGPISLRGAHYKNENEEDGHNAESVPDDVPQQDPVEKHAGLEASSGGCVPACFAKYEGFDSRTTGTTLSSFTLSTIFEDVPDDGSYCIPSAHSQQDVLLCGTNNLQLAAAGAGAGGPLLRPAPLFPAAPPGQPDVINGMIVFPPGANGLQVPVTISYHNNLYQPQGGIINGNLPNGGSGCPPQYPPGSLGGDGQLGGGELSLLPGGGCGVYGNPLGADARLYSIMNSSHLSTVFEDIDNEGVCGDCCQSVGECSCADGSGSTAATGRAHSGSGLLRGLSVPESVATPMRPGSTENTPSPFGSTVRPRQGPASAPAAQAKANGAGSLAVWYF